MGDLSFANQILADWNSAMDQFFTRVDRKRRDQGLSVEAVEDALDGGYGDGVADNWAEWIADGI